LVVSLEVIEHIDSKYTDVLLNTITKHGDLILFSGSAPNQTEDPTHVTMRWPSHWINIFKEYGYSVLVNETLDIRSKLANADWWIVTNLLLFKKDTEEKDE